MKRIEVIHRLKRAQPDLRAYGIAALYLFGSYARDEAGPDSDVDIFVDPSDTSAFGLEAYVQTSRLLEEAFPDQEIGYSTRDSIVPLYLPLIERDAIRIF